MSTDNLDAQKLKSLFLLGLVIFGAAWLYAWSVGADPMLALRIAGGALAPWILGKCTDADKSAPSIENIKALVSK